MENQEKTSFREHRVGSVTAGVSMIVFGMMFILQLFFNILNYEIIFKLWPLILIGLGIEILLSNAFAKKFVYDKGAVALLLIMSFLAVGMACTDVVIDRVQKEVVCENTANVDR